MLRFVAVPFLLFPFPCTCTDMVWSTQACSVRSPVSGDSPFTTSAWWICSLSVFWSIKYLFYVFLTINRFYKFFLFSLVKYDVAASIKRIWDTGRQKIIYIGTAYKIVFLFESIIRVSFLPQSTHICRVQSCVWRLPKYWPPPTPLPLASVSSPRIKGGSTVHTRRAAGGGGSIFWKTPDIGSASYSIISLRPLLCPVPSQTMFK